VAFWPSAGHTRSSHLRHANPPPACLKRAKTRHDGSVLVEARIPEAIANAAANAGAANAAVYARSEALFARPFSLAHDILRPLIGPEPEVDGLAQLALAGPLRELHLGNQRGLDPRRDGLVFHFGRKG
jgi:hypothetical protein